MNQDTLLEALNSCSGLRCDSSWTFTKVLCLCIQSNTTESRVQADSCSAISDFSCVGIIHCLSFLIYSSLPTLASQPLPQHVGWWRRWSKTPRLEWKGYLFQMKFIYTRQTVKSDFIFRIKIPQKVRFEHSKLQNSFNVGSYHTMFDRYKLKNVFEAKLIILLILYTVRSHRCYQCFHACGVKVSH